MCAALEGSEDRRSFLKRRLKELEYAELTSEARQNYYTSSYYVSSILAGNPVLPSGSPQEYLSRRNKSPLRDYAEQLRPLLDSIPSTLGSRSLRQHPVKVGIIADEFLYKSFDSTAAIAYVTPENYRDVAENVEFLIVASTWRGINDEWLGLATPKSTRRMFLLQEVLPHFRSMNLPIVFFSKEDPPNYEQFLSIAQAANFVFTSAAEVIDDYWRDCEQVVAVEVLSFGVNPLHHSPVYSRRHRVGDVLFAGSWHAHKYPERRAAARAIFNGVIESSRNLIIFDRNWDLENSRYFFPEEYAPHLAPSVDHDLLLKLQRISDFNINLNSVIGSQSMYANRVVELQAMGSMVISNYNAGINNRFPNVLTSDTSVDVRETLDKMSAVELYEVQMEGLRRAYSDHLSHDRMGDILRVVGGARANARPRVCAVVEDPSDALRGVAAHQTLTGVAVVTAAELQRRRGEFDIAAPLSDQFTYAATHLEDLANGFKYADVDFVMKALATGSGSTTVPEHEASARMPEPAVGAVWLASEAGERYLRGVTVEGSGYALDPLGIQSRQEAIDLGSSRPETDGNPLVSVIVPVYNNGHYLLNKCIRSLSRSSIFARMEILIIDDGSSDVRTHQILDDITNQHHQVRLYKFDVGGSGSASRARNKGLEMATAPWITYLDPDNEAVCDGYAKLVELAIGKSLDFALGDMLMYSDRTKLFANAKHLSRHLEEFNGEKVVPQHDILRRLVFYPMSIQAMVINAEWLKGLGLEQPVGALGQDSFFFQQLMHHARRIDVLEEPIHIYYSSVSRSVVNTVSPEFFRKYLPLEAARAKWLQEIGLIDAYRKTRAQSFMKHWYLSKLKLVDEKDVPECISVLQQLASFYGPVMWEDAEVAAVLGGKPQLPVNQGT